MILNLPDSSLMVRAVSTAKE